MGEKKFRAGRAELEPLEINPKGKVGRPPFDHNCHIFFINGRDLNWMCQINIEFENIYEANCKKPFQYFK